MSSNKPPEKKVLEQTNFSLSNYVGEDSRAFLMRYGIVAALIVAACFMMYITYGNPEARTKSFYYYLFLCTVPVIIAMYIVSPLYTEKLTKSTMFVYGFATIIVLIGLYYFYMSTNRGYISILSTLSTGVAILGIIVGLAILYRVIQRYVNMATGWGGFILQFIFYLPCLLIDFVEEFLTEMRMAPNMVSVLFVIEILIVLSYLYLPALLKYIKIAGKGAKELVGPKPVFLNRSAVVARNDDFLMDKNAKENPEKTEDVIRTNYSVAFWAFINEGAVNTKECNIFSYSPPGIYRGKPAVKYQRGKINFYLSNSGADALSVSTPVQNQKWNYVVVTYDNQKVDVYLNAELKYSVSLNEDNIPDYSPIDVIQIGEKDGVYGAIKNLVYYATPIHLGEIIDNYNISKYAQ